jgi:hypothetical protein
MFPTDRAAHLQRAAEAIEELEEVMACSIDMIGERDAARLTSGDRRLPSELQAKCSQLAQNH